MGYTLRSYLSQAPDPAALREEFGARKSVNAAEVGTSDRSGSMFLEGLVVAPAQPFPDLVAAEAWMHDHAASSTAFALRIVPRASKPSAAAMARSVDRNAVAGLRHAKAVQAPLRRILTAKARLLTCSNCGSKMSREHLRSYVCPVCGEDTLLNASERARIIAATEAYDATKAALAALRAAAGAPDGPCWYVGAWVSV